MEWKYVFEFIMLACFGAAWPVSIYKSWTSRSCKGKSFFFLVIIITGYVSGIIKCMLDNTHWIVMVLYFINATMVSIDAVLYFRNLRIERGEK